MEHLGQNPETGASQHSRAFDCPHCNVYAHQESGVTYWFDGEKPSDPHSMGKTVTSVTHMEKVGKFDLFKCQSCYQFSIWIGEELVYPKQSQAPKPHEEMPEKVKRDFNEARVVVEESPRAAAALLRLAIERLMDYLASEGGSLSIQIGNLVDEGRINPRIQKALDSVRVVGNESVHPGTMDMDDNREIANTLFKLVNAIVDETIGREQTIEGIYATLPDNKLEGIENRDGYGPS